jgi:hypothetical protein
MRDRWLIVGTALGAVLLLPIAGSAQTLAVPPSWAPSLAQSPTVPPPEESPPAAAPATDAGPATQAKPAEKLKTRATAQTRKTSKTAKAKPREMTAPVAQAAAPAAAAGEAVATAKRKDMGRHRLDVAREPRDIVATIYKVAAGKDGSYDGPSAFDDPRIRKLYFSRGLIAAVAGAEKKTAGASILNFDPITNSETDVEDLAIAPESEKADRMSIAARFNSESDSSIIHYDFVKEGKVWKLDDIRGELVGQQGQWSLRDILKNNSQRS